MTNNNLLSSMGNSIQHSVMIFMGKKNLKKSGYMCITEIPGGL